MFFWGAYLEITMPCGILCRSAVFVFFSPGLERLEGLERRIIATSDESLQRPGNEQNIPVFQVYGIIWYLQSWNPHIGGGSCSKNMGGLWILPQNIQKHGVLLFFLCARIDTNAAVRSRQARSCKYITHSNYI